MQIRIWGICWSGILSTSGTLARSALPSSEDSLHSCIVGYFWFKTQWLWTDFTFRAKLELQLTPFVRRRSWTWSQQALKKGGVLAKLESIKKAQTPYQRGSFQTLQYQGSSILNKSWCCHAEIDRSSRRWRTWWHCARGSPRHPFLLSLFVVRFTFRTLGRPKQRWKAVLLYDSWMLGRLKERRHWESFL